jgi:hypothetical protein
LRPDYLILGLDEPEAVPALCGFLLGRYPGMKIFAVGAEYNRSVFYWAIIDIRSKRGAVRGVIIGECAASDLGARLRLGLRRAVGILRLWTAQRLVETSEQGMLSVLRKEAALWRGFMDAPSAPIPICLVVNA